MDDNSAQPEAATTEGPITRVARVTLITLIVVASCYVARGYWRMFSSWRGGGQTVAVESSPINVDALPGVLPLSGPWSFGDFGWALRSEVVDTAEVDSRFDQVANDDASSPDELPDVDEQLLELVQNLQIEPTHRNGKQIYRVERPAFKGQLVVIPLVNHTKAVSMSAAVPQGDGKWQLFDFTPRIAADGNGTETNNPLHLLPLPAGAMHEGGRYANDGQLLLEFASVQSTAEELVSHWKRYGWSVRPSGLGGPDAVSYLAARGGEVVYAWSADSRDEIRNLMLVRNPAAADTIDRGEANGLRAPDGSPDPQVDLLH